MGEHRPRVRVLEVMDYVLRQQRAQLKLELDDDSIQHLHAWLKDQARWADKTEGRRCAGVEQPVPQSMLDALPPPPAPRPRKGYLHRRRDKAASP